MLTQVDPAANYVPEMQYATKEERELPEDSGYTECDIKQSLSLIDQAQKDLDLNTLRDLLKMYTTTLDWVTQERIEKIIAVADKELWIISMLEEMPRLCKEAPAWAVSLLGEEIEQRFMLLQKCLATMPEEVKTAVHSVINSEDFTSFYSNTESLI